MTARSVGLSPMFGWIAETFRLVFRNAGTMAAASAVTLGLFLAVFVPIYALLFFSVLKGAVPGVPGAVPAINMTLFWIVYLLSILAGMLLVPPIVIGWLRLCAQADRGAPAGASGILRPYRDGVAWRRGIGAALLALAMYVVALGAVMLAFMAPMTAFAQQVAAQQAAQLAGVPVTPQMPPSGIFLAYLVLIVVMGAMQAVYVVMFSEVALRPTPVLAAARGALVAVGRNLHKLVLVGLVLAFVGVVALLLAALVLGLVIGAAFALSKALGVLLAIACYVALLLMMYPLMFASGYVMWKGMLGDEASDPSPPAEAGVIGA